MILTKIANKKRHGKEPLVQFTCGHIRPLLAMLSQRHWRKKLLIKSRSEKQKKEERRDQDGILNIHLP